MTRDRLATPNHAGPPTGPGDAQIAAGDLRLVQLRLWLVAVASALLGAGMTGFFVLFIGGGAWSEVRAAVASAPTMWQLGLVAAIAGTGTLTLYVGRLVVRPARRLELFSREYSRLYEVAQLRALQDSLTGLGNHRAFQDEFDRQLDYSQRHGIALALALLDLDDLKRINDTAGHAAGDEALVELARRMTGSLRSPDRSFRIGGDEFAILMPHTSPEEARIAIGRLLAAALEPSPGSAFPKGISFSAGIAGTSGTAATRQDIFAEADEALYAAKHEGRTLVKVFEPELAAKGLVGPALGRATDALARLIANRDLRPVYQPIVDMAAGRVIGFEALVRPGPASGFADPSALFEAATAGGRTLELDLACIEIVLAGASQLPADQWLAINVSPATFGAHEFSVALLVQAAARVGLVPGRVALELTEREVVADAAGMRLRLAAFQAAGFRVAIDDVGAGNAGLRLLSQIHFDIVKIDLSLVHEGARRDASREVLRAMIGLAGRWDAMTIAEGVETPAQLRLVRELGFTASQGYLLGRPGWAADARSVDLAALVREADMREVLAGVRGSLNGPPTAARVLPVPGFELIARQR